MLVILIEMLLILWLIWKERRLISYPILFICFALQIIILVSYRIEIVHMWNREVYWSDAEYYWKATLALLKGVNIRVNNFGYVLYSYLIEKSSPFVSVIWINISNTLLLNISFLIALDVFKQFNKDSIVRLPHFFYFTTIGNPLVIYALMRNLKDSLFLFLTTWSVLIIVRKMRRPTINAVSLLLFLSIYVFAFSVILTSIRPWGWLIPGTNVLISMMINRQKLGQKTKGVLIIAFAIIVTLVFSKIQSIVFWLKARELLIKSGVEYYGFLGFISSVFRLILGPGPIRPIFGHRYFKYFTYIGNISSFFGALIWYFSIPTFFVTLSYLATNSYLRKHYFKTVSIFFLVLSIIFITIYSFFYGGAVELRFRGILYLLITFSVLSIFLSNIKKIGVAKHEFLIRYSIVFAIISIFGTLMSI